MPMTTDGTDENPLGGPHEDIQADGEVGNRSDLVNLPLESAHISFDSIIPPPTIDLIKNISGSPYTGAGTGISGATVFIYLTGVAEGIVGSGRVESGKWSGAITYPVNRNKTSIDALQRLDGLYSERSAPMEIYRAVVTYPQPNTTESANGLIFRGIGAPNSKVRVVKSPPNHDEVLSAETSIDEHGNWQAPLTAGLLNGPLSVSALVSYVGTTSIYTLPVAFVVHEAPPFITNPPANSLQNQTFNLSGLGGVAGSTVQVFLDLSESKVGEAFVTGDAWTVPVSVRPGPVSLVAIQISDPPSGRGHPRAFKIRPAKPEQPVIDFSDDAIVRFSGKGHYDPHFPTRIQLTVKTGQGNAPAIATVQNDGTWATSATGWELGSRTLEAIQQIADKAGGWIDSLPFEFEVEKKLPPVSNVRHTDDYQPTFSGEGVDRATVSLFVGAEIATPVVVRNRQWSTQALESWGPTNKRKISIRQELDGSEGWLEYEVSILPREPGIDVPPEDGLNPVFSGTCWPGAVVNISFSDSNHSFTATVLGETWTFCRPTPFTDGLPCTIEATQTVVGLTSEPGSLTFKVYRERLKPAIRTPLPEQETDSDLTVTGDFGMSGASMRLWNLQDGKPLGDPVVLGQDGPWSVRLTGLAIKTWFITAQQTLNDRASPDSEVRQFDVVVMPPEFVRPLPGGDLTRTAVLSGTGRRDGLVTVWRRGLDEPLLRDVQIGVDGTWEASVVLEVGDEILWATQTFEGKTSKPSLDVPCRVVPVAVMPESPTPEEFLGATVTVSGFGVPGDLITLKRGECVLGTAPVLDDASWSIPATLELPDGAVTLSVMASKGEYHSIPSEWECQARLFLPQFIYPGPGLWVPPLVAVTGLGKPGIGTLLSWYSADVVLAGPITVTDAGWTASPTEPLHSGAQWCRFRQISDTGAPMSDDAESARFDVRVDSPDNA
ncbi:hypothetical protein [Pseudomonas moraviensis]